MKTRKVRRSVIAAKHKFTKHTKRKHHGGMNNKQQAIINALHFAYRTNDPEVSNTAIKTINTHIVKLVEPDFNKMTIADYYNLNSCVNINVERELLKKEIEKLENRKNMLENEKKREERIGFASRSSNASRASRASRSSRASNASRSIRSTVSAESFYPRAAILQGEKNNYSDE